MEADKSTMDFTETLEGGEEVIKTQIAFKKGIIAGVLILVLILAIGILIGYSIGQYITTNHYTALMAEQAKKCIFLG